VKHTPRRAKIAVACVLVAVLALGVDWGRLPKHLARLDRGWVCWPADVVYLAFAGIG
jgi:hypothetical protein